MKVCLFEVQLNRLIFCSKKLNMFADLYSKQLGNQTLKIMRKTWKFT